MKTNKSIQKTLLLPIGLLLMLLMGCERDVSDLGPASFSNNPEVFIDGFSPGLNYAAFGGSVPTAFDVDRNVTYNNSKASMRIEVPDAGDPRGAYAGGVYFTSVGRNLTEYNVLTFWAKASQPATIDLVGFGLDLGQSKYETSISGLPVNTNWKKYYIPIPDPSRLTMERGLFYYSEGPEDGKGYTIWIDEVKFENLGTIAHPVFTILNGTNSVETSFIGVSKKLSGLTSVFNLPTGVNQIVNAAPAYFSFSSSNESVATVDEFGNITVVGGPGNAQIKATVGDIPAEGSLTIQSVGAFQHALTPVHAPGNVTSIFSDAYNNVPVDYYNGYWAPWQTTQSADFVINGDHILHYTDFNFVGIQFSSPTINATARTHLHLDIYLPNTLASNAQFRIELLDNAGGGTGLYTTTITVAQSQQWISLNIPFTSFTGLTSRTSLWQLVFVDVNGNIPSFYADNIYFYN